MNEVAPVLLTFILVIGFFFGLIYSSGQQDKINCYTWQHEAATYPGFFLTQAEADQCDYYHIPVAATVK